MFYSDVSYSNVLLTHTVTRKTKSFFLIVIVFSFLQNLTKTIFIEILHVHKENPGWHQHVLV